MSRSIGVTEKSLYGIFIREGFTSSFANVRPHSKLEQVIVRSLAQYVSHLPTLGITG